MYYYSLAIVAKKYNHRHHLLENAHEEIDVAYCIDRPSSLVQFLSSIVQLFALIFRTEEIRNFAFLIGSQISSII
jgi:hypothetical protein